MDRRTFLQGTAFSAAALATAGFPEGALAGGLPAFQIIEDGFVEHPVAGRVRRVHVAVAIDEFPGIESRMVFRSREGQGCLAFLFDGFEQDGLTAAQWETAPLVAHPHTPDQRLTWLCSDVDFPREDGSITKWRGASGRDEQEWWTFHGKDGGRVHVFAARVDGERYLPTPCIEVFTHFGSAPGRPRAQYSIEGALG